MTAKTNRDRTTWRCIFGTRFFRTEIQPQVQAEWRAKTGKEAPYGALQTIWRRQHCMILNHWGSDECPYDETECALAYLTAIRHAIEDSHRSPKGWFFAHAKIQAILRADHKPLARDRATTLELRTDGQEGDSGAPTPSAHAGRGVSRTNTGPQRIGQLLGSLDVRPHQGPAEDGKESTK